MIIACPACATRYVVPDSAIGVEGRTVRCAKCKHSWFQDGPELAEPIAAAYGAPVPAMENASAAAPARPRPAPPAESPPRPTQRADEPVAQPPSARPPSPEPHRAAPPEDQSDAPANIARAAEPAAEPPLSDRGFDNDVPAPAAWAGEDEAAARPGEDVSHFDHGVPFTGRRNWLRWLTWGAGAFALLALAAVVAISTLGVPSWLPIDKPLFGVDPGLKVEFPASEQERRTLPNGAEFFGARVVVKNEARETKRVPPLLIVLRDARERVVYSWELIPPQRSLAPGEAMTINEAMTDVPKSAVYAEIGWAPR